MCKRTLSATEPVWHVRPGRSVIWRDFSNANVVVACERCKAKPPKGAEWLFEDRSWRPQWRAARPCSFCGRPVFKRLVLQRAAFVCGDECREEAARQRRRQRYGTPLPRACAKCGKRFRPQRS